VLRGRSQEPLVVRVAADHPVEHDHVERLDTLRIDGDVLQAPLRALLEPCLSQEPLRLPLVGWGELEVHCPDGAALQQLDLDLADAAADLEYGRTLDPALLEKLDDPPRRLVKTPLSVALRNAASKAGREEPVAAARIAATRHSESLRDGGLAALSSPA
jgi:hypothetical protein